MILTAYVCEKHQGFLDCSYIRYLILNLFLVIAFGCFLRSTLDKYLYYSQSNNLVLCCSYYTANKNDKAEGKTGETKKPKTTGTVL